MEITNAFLEKGASHGRPGTLYTPRGVVVHYIGNPGTSATANRNYFNNSGVASCQYIVGLQGEILQLMPENEVAWHAGKSYATKYNEMAKTNNSRFIGIETCHPDTSGKFTDVTYNSLVELVADICIRRKFNVNDDVYRHYDVTGKSCPLYYVNNPSAWAQFKKDVQVKIDARQEAETVQDLKISVNGKEVTVKAVLKDDYNYVNLRDLCNALNVNVDYDANKKMPVLTSKQ